MHLKYILRQIEPDRDNILHDRSPLWINDDPLWHVDAVGGQSHRQSRVRPLQPMSKVFLSAIALAPLVIYWV